MKNKFTLDGCRTQPSNTQPIQRKPPAPAITIPVASELAYRWLQLGQSTRTISRNLEIHDREMVESAIRVALSRGPLPQIRRVA